MKNSNWMCLRPGWGVVPVAAFCIWGLVAGGGYSRAAQSQAEASASEVTAYLDYHPSQAVASSYGLPLTFEPQSKTPFRKEPATGRRTVVRGYLRFGPTTASNARAAVGTSEEDQRIACLWDVTQGKLYVDLNRNGDLTDDPAGVYSYPVPASSRAVSTVQNFSNVRLYFKTPAGDHPLAVDLMFYNSSSRPQITATCRSYWGGKVSLQGRDWQVGIMDGFKGKEPSPEGGQLLLRPWEEQARPVQATADSLEVIPYYQNLFLGSTAYRLETVFENQDGTPKYKVVFKERQVELGELAFTGKYVRRLLLTANEARQTQPRYTVLLDTPGPTNKVPVGTYTQCRVQLQTSRGVQVSTDSSMGIAPLVNSPVVVSSTKPGVLKAGGPLTNVVKATSQGRILKLDYQLVSADGRSCRLSPEDRSKPPEWVISQNGKTIASGKFQYG